MSAKYMYHVIMEYEHNGNTYTRNKYFSNKTLCYRYLKGKKPEELKDGLIHEYRSTNGEYFNHNNEIVVITLHGVKRWNLPSVV